MFQIDLRSQRSIYEQIIDNIKELIIRGALEPDSDLPSVRELSRMLTVNPNTVQKAFKELEREGFVYTVKGKGTFVNPDRNAAPDPEAIRAICAGIRSSVQELCYLGVDGAKIKSLVAEIAEDPFGKGSSKSSNEDAAAKETAKTAKEAKTAETAKAVPAMTAAEPEKAAPTTKAR